MAFILPTPPTKDAAIGNFQNAEHLDIFQTFDANGSLLASMNYLGVMNVPTAQVSIAPLVSLTTLSTAQLLNLSTTPVQIGPTPAKGTYTVPLYYTFKLNFGGTPFSIANGGAGSTRICWNGNSAICIAGVPDTAILWTSTTSQLYTSFTITQDMSGTITSLPFSDIANQPITLSMDDALSGGNGTLDVWLSYVIAPAA